VNEAKLEMLWDSGAANTVMSEECWMKIGEPQLSDYNVMLNGVFLSSGERPLGSMVLNVK